VTAYLFVGPTLTRDEVAALGAFRCLPPVAQGDVYRLARRGPDAIGIIDGFFSGAPSVWHKEILWALSQGIAVFGSASMGALRAAELHGFGMRGVGRIFEAYRDGLLEDDDEVAVVHGPAETGFIAASEPMVNIRATLERAETDGVLSGSARRALERHAKALFFPHRNWDALLAAASGLGVGDGEREALAARLPGGRVDQKREDALAMIAAMAEMPIAGGAARPGFRFEWTHYWQSLVSEGALDGAFEDTAADPDRFVLDELRLQGEEAWRRAGSAALLRLLADAEARRRGIEPAPEALRAELARMRGELGLFSRAELDAWLALNGLNAAALERLIAERCRAEALSEVARADLEPHMLDELRVNDCYRALAERARRKRDLIAKASPDASTAPASPALRLWYFERKLGRTMPDDVEAYARSLGFADLAQFDRAVRLERLLDEQSLDGS
jgi:hypothetical protein